MARKGTVKIGNNGFGFSAEELRRRRNARNFNSSSNRGGQKLDKSIFGKKLSNGVTPINPSRFAGINAAERFISRREMREITTKVAPKGLSAG